MATIAFLARQLTLYIFEESQISGMVSGNDTLWFMFDADGNRYGLTYNGTPYFYIYNQQGDVISIADENANIVCEYSYDAWGKLLAVTDSLSETLGNINPFRYRGYCYDDETGLYYLNSRYYDAEVCRFVNADSLLDNRSINTHNLFVYCGNNPVNNIDLNGHLFGAIIGIGLIVVGMVVALSGCSKSNSKPSTSRRHFSSKTTAASTMRGTTTAPHVPSQKEKSYAATVYAEAGGQNKRSKQAVAHVMNNRVGTKSSWTDIQAVISAKYQFDGYNSPMYQAAMNYYNNGVCDNSISRASMDECMDVIIPIYSGVEADITGGALYFHSFPNPSDWKYHNDYTQVYVSGTEKFWFYK